MWQPDPEIGFTGCGNTQVRPGFVTGHDLSRAASASKSAWASAPAACSFEPRSHPGVFPQTVQPHASRCPVLPGASCLTVKEQRIGLMDGSHRYPRNVDV